MVDTFSFFLTHESTLTVRTLVVAFVPAIGHRADHTHCHQKMVISCCEKIVRFHFGRMFDQFRCVQTLALPNLPVTMPWFATFTVPDCALKVPKSNLWEEPASVTSNTKWTLKMAKIDTTICCRIKETLFALHATKEKQKKKLRRQTTESRVNQKQWIESFLNGSVGCHSWRRHKWLNKRFVCNFARDNKHTAQTHI